MRIRDWSSDGCSSDLLRNEIGNVAADGKGPWTAPGRIKKGLVRRPALKVSRRGCLKGLFYVHCGMYFRKCEKNRGVAIFASCQPPCFAATWKKDAWSRFASRSKRRSSEERRVGKECVSKSRSRGV